MSQSGQRTALGSFTIAVDGAGTKTLSHMTLQHIVKPTAAERIPDATPATDVGKFIELFEPDMGSDIKIPPFTIEDAISDVDPLPERNTLDSKSTIDVEQQGLLPDMSSPCVVKGWRWALVVSAILSSLFLFNLDNTIVGDIQPAITETFEDVGKLPWLGVAFLLGAASTNLVSIFL
jgi:hypothetical protein